MILVGFQYLCALISLLQLFVQFDPNHVQLRPVQQVDAMQKEEEGTHIVYISRHVFSYCKLQLILIYS
jgi:hypothetical protein